MNRKGINEQNGPVSPFPVQSLFCHPVVAFLEVFNCDEFLSGVSLGRNVEARRGGADDRDDGVAVAQRAGNPDCLRSAAAPAISAASQVREEGILRRPKAPPPSPPPQQQQLEQDVQAPQIKVFLNPTPAATTTTTTS